MKAINIQWDSDVPELPNEIEIPENIPNDEDAISDYLSDVTGFCHKSFGLDKTLQICENLIL